MKPCTCRHLGHCPFYEPDTNRTDGEGTRLWRELTGLELAEADVKGHDAALQRGDLVRTRGDGEVEIRGRAIDPDLAVAHVSSKQGRRCKADRFMWRRRHPVRARDLNCVMFDPPTRPEEVTAWVQGGSLLMGHPNATTLFTFGDLERM